MIRLTRAQPQPIGLDIGHDSIKMLQLEVVNNALHVVAAAHCPFGADAQADPTLRMPLAVDMIRTMLRTNPFMGRRVIAALPRQIVHMKNLRLPVMPAVELAAAVQFEARNIFAFDVEAATVQFLPVGEVRQGSELLQEVIVMAARHEDIDVYVEQLHRCGVIIDSLDSEPCALYRSLERFLRRREDEQEVHVLLDIGLRRSQVLIGKGHDITFYKPLDAAGMALHEAVSRKLGISVTEAQALRRRLVENETAATGQQERDPVRQAVFDATRSVLEELGREVALCLRYHSVTFRGHRPVKVRVIGGEAADPNVPTVLNTVLPIPAETGRPLRNVNTSKMKPADRRGAMSEWALALALGLKRTEGKFGLGDGKPRGAEPPPAATAPATPAEPAAETAARTAVASPARKSVAEVAHA
jgi:type IV pilus assembly protein PilM